MPAMKSIGATTADMLLADVFRRADKSLNGSLAWDDFSDFFAEKDGCLSLAQLEDIFRAMDPQDSTFVSTEEFQEFCTEKVSLGPFEQVFGALHDLAKVMPSILVDESLLSKSPGTDCPEERAK